MRIWLVGQSLARLLVGAPVSIGAHSEIARLILNHFFAKKIPLWPLFLCDILAEDSGNWSDVDSWDYLMRVHPWRLQIYTLFFVRTPFFVFFECGGFNFKIPYFVYITISPHHASLWSKARLCHFWKYRCPYVGPLEFPASIAMKTVTRLAIRPHRECPDLTSRKLPIPVQSVCSLHYFFQFCSVLTSWWESSHNDRREMKKSKILFITIQIKKILMDIFSIWLLTLL